MDLDNEQDNGVGLRLFAITLPPGVSLAENILENTESTFDDFEKSTAVTSNSDIELLSINESSMSGVVNLHLDNEEIFPNTHTVIDNQQEYIAIETLEASNSNVDEDSIGIQPLENIGENFECNENQYDPNGDQGTELFLDDCGNIYVLTDNEVTDIEEEQLIEEQPSYTSNNYINILQQYGLAFIEEGIAANNQLNQENEDKEVSDVSEEDEVDIETLADVVQALKCKECSFTTLDKTALITHHKKFHLNEINLSNNDEATDTNKSSVKQVTYVCAQCSKQLPTVQACRLHMINDHHLQPTKSKNTDESDNSDSKNKAADNDKRKSKNTDLKHHQMSMLSKLNDETDEDNPSDDENGESSKTNKKEGELSHLLQIVRNYWLQPKTPKELRARLCSDRKVKCTVRKCLFRFNSVESMILHRACHSEADSIRTTYQRSPHTAPTPPFTCSICNASKNATFNAWPNCSLHMWHTHNLAIDLIQCPICSVVRTHSVAKMVRHLAHHARAHRKKTSCNKCETYEETSGQSDKGEFDQAASVRWYTQKRCEICKKLYGNSKTLRKHIQAVHNKIKPFICNVCGHSAASKHMLQLHMRQHTGEKPYSCEFCTYRTGDHNTLRKHRMRHTGERPYSCPHCKYSAIQAGALNSHMKSTHPKEPPLTCHHKKKITPNVK